MDHRKCIQVKLKKSHSKRDAIEIFLKIKNNFTASFNHFLQDLFAKKDILIEYFTKEATKD